MSNAKKCWIAVEGNPDEAGDYFVQSKDGNDLQNDIMYFNGKKWCPNSPDFECNFYLKEVDISTLIGDVDKRNIETIGGYIMEVDALREENRKLHEKITEYKSIPVENVSDEAVNLLKELYDFTYDILGGKNAPDSGDSKEFVKVRKFLKKAAQRTVSTRVRRNDAAMENKSLDNKNFKKEK